MSPESAEGFGAQLGKILPRRLNGGASLGKKKVVHKPRQIHERKGERRKPKTGKSGAAMLKRHKHSGALPDDQYRPLD